MDYKKKTLTLSNATNVLILVPKSFFFAIDVLPRKISRFMASVQLTNWMLAI